MLERGKKKLLINRGKKKLLINRGKRKLLLELVESYITGKIMTWKWYVYIIECENKTYYTGMTWKPDRRWLQHLSRLGSKYTSRHKPVKLVYLEEYEDFNQARLREKQVKKWSQKKKKKLIRGEWGKWM